MKFFSTLVALALPAIAFAIHYEAPYIKSFADAQSECQDYLRLTNDTIDRYVKSGYPDEESTRKLVHCILINVNAWDNDAGILDYVFKNYFIPCAGDNLYNNRTQQCLRDTVAPLTRRDQLKRAHRAFLCYYRNYGNIVPDAQFVPYTKDTRWTRMNESIAIQYISRAGLESFAKGNILDVPEFPELAYTYTVRTGFYEPETGIHTGRVYTQFGLPEILSDKTKCCEANVRQQYCDEPARLYQTFKQCYVNLLPTLALLQEVAQLLLQIPALPQCGCPPPPPPPCGAPVPSPVPCSSCGSPAPCTTCSASSNPRPCYNGQCS